MEAGQSSKQYGRELLESILNDGTASTSKVTGASSAMYFTSRVEGRRLQLGNQDRSRPVARIDTLAHHQIQKRDKRVLKKKTKNGTLHQYEKGKQREERKPMSRRQRQRQGLDTMDDQLSFETLEPIHQLWLDYIHRFMGFIDENGLIQTNNHFSIVHERNGQPHISLNANAINSFQSSIVKADFCGAPIKSEFVISLHSIYPHRCVHHYAFFFHSNTSAQSITCRDRRFNCKGDKFYLCHCDQITTSKGKEE